MTSIFSRVSIALLITGLTGCAMTTSSRSAYADVNGLHMYYEEHGSGRPLLLLHGGGSTLQTSFGTILPKLARTHRVIAPEQQGHGHTPDIGRPFSLVQMADDTAALLEKLGVHDVDVIGFSNGGATALQLAIRHPGLVHRLVVCSGYAAHGDLVPGFWEGFDHATLEVMPAPLKEAYLSVAPDPDGLKTLFSKTVAMMKGFTDIPDAQLQSIRAPTLVMVGDSDVITPEGSARIARTVAHGQLAVLPGAAHGAYLGVAELNVPGSPLPELSVAMIERFLHEP